MTFSQLEIFVKVAEQHSFTLAARQLGITQSAVSHALKCLEQHWNVSLFSREQGAIALTHIGQQLLLHAKEVLNTTQIMQQEVNAAHGIQQGTLRIGSFGSSSSIHLLPELLKAYRERYPHIEIFVEEGTDAEVSQWIAERQVDVGFAVLPKSQLVTFPLIKDIFIALIPDSFEVAQQAKLNIQDIQNYPFIMTRAGSQSHVEKLLQQHQIQPKITYQMSQLLTILNMVNLQEGIAIVADMAMPKELLALHPHVVKRPLSPNTQRQIGLAVKNQQLISPACKAFIELAQQKFYQSN
ncbi:LysR family transcriptional regulator [Acinetobacter gandensis]|uniref:LysR family transcriptional regulator n=1 Tax=Acinetobacter gandensis TaxID=1443941 RepID=A0A1A7R867_9GAMM|nr:MULTISPECIES: LysR family transcriptional regulator [Acinetobacter]KAB0624608.1 LysR family transcriptional regulator [Acinetobacter gandensis]OBX28081.1 LysR family transcriptional regulator [Acinetobacter gandensis]